MGGAPRVPHVDVGIIGAGFSGLGAGIRLDAAGRRDWLILESADEVGGTWRDNTYPGAACDIPSHVYSFSFEPNDWSQAYAPQREIQEYLVRVSHKYGLRDRIRFGRRVLSAVWEDRRWRLTCQGGEQLTCTVLIGAIGGLRDPSIPDIPGLETFEGPRMHTARWDHSVDMEGKRVGVIGTGASAIQVIPALGWKVRHLVVFQRTAPWIVPRHNRRYSRLERAVYKRVPTARRLHRLRLYLKSESRYLAFGPARRVLKPVARKIARDHLRRQVTDPARRERLTPTFEIGCKRVLIDDHYYPALAAPNATVEPRPIERITPVGVQAGGQEHQLDALVLATGFKINQPLGQLDVQGPAGSLKELWAERPRSFLGMVMPGFPNLFFMIGPNAGLGHNSIVFMIECQLNYILGAIGHTLDGGQSLDLQAPAMDAFMGEVDDRSGDTVWKSGCHSWYLTPDGRNFALWPGSTVEYWWRTRQFDPSVYRTV